MKQNYMTGHQSLASSALIVLFTALGCASKPTPVPPERPSLAPTSQPARSLSLDPAAMKPMYRELLAIDLPTVTRVAAAQNPDIQQAKLRVEAQRGRYD